ncbi:hypothetical protein GCM10027262_61500 [Nocardia tengchongensis]
MGVRIEFILAIEIRVAVQFDQQWRVYPGTVEIQLEIVQCARGQRAIAADSRPETNFGVEEEDIDDRTERVRRRIQCIRIAAQVLEPVELMPHRGDEFGH